MSGDGEEHVDTSLQRDLLEAWNAIKPILRRLPTAKKAIDKLTGGLGSAGAEALNSRLRRYRTDNLVKEAQQVADTTGLPVPVVFDTLSRQRRIDELTMDALRRVGETVSADDDTTADAGGGGNKHTTDRWFHTLYDEAGKVDEEDVREAFVRILAGEIQVPGSFSVRTLRVVGDVSRSTAK